MSGDDLCGIACTSDSSCGGYVCDSSTTACKTSCSSSSDCNSGYTCSSGACLTRAQILGISKISKAPEAETGSSSSTTGILVGVGVLVIAGAAYFMYGRKPKAKKK